jgi:hypothetical protein
MDFIELRYEALKLYRLAQSEPDYSERLRLTLAADAAAERADRLIDE